MRIGAATVLLAGANALAWQAATPPSASPAPDSLLQQADEDTRDVILGKKDVHQAMISIERAHLSLRLMIQVRNKVISAYEEIMRMQI